MVVERVDLPGTPKHEPTGRHGETAEDQRLPEGVAEVREATAVRHKQQDPGQQQPCTLDRRLRALGRERHADCLGSHVPGLGTGVLDRGAYRLGGRVGVAAGVVRGAHGRLGWLLRFGSRFWG